MVKNPEFEAKIRRDRGRFAPKPSARPAMLAQRRRRPDAMLSGTSLEDLTADDIRDALGEETFEDALDRIVDGDLDPWTVDRLSRLGDETDGDSGWRTRVRWACIKSGSLSDRRLQELSSDRAWPVRLGAIQSNRLPDDVVERIARDDDVDEVQDTARALLASRSKDPEERAQAASSPGTPAAALRRLVKDPDRKVRLSLIANLRLDTRMADELSHDRSPMIRSMLLAAKPWKLSASRVNEMSRDKDPQVRMAAALSQRLPENDLQRLARDDSPIVRNAATGQLASTKHSRQEKQSW